MPQLVFPGLSVSWISCGKLALKKYVDMFWSYLFFCLFLLLVPYLIDFRLLFLLGCRYELWAYEIYFTLTEHKICHIGVVHQLMD